MGSFAQTLNPTPFGTFDSDAAFQSDADRMLVFVKQKLGDAPLSVELSNKQIWTCFEEATAEYSNQVAKLKIQSDLINLLGMATGSVSGALNLYPRQTLEFLMRMAEPYGAIAGAGGSYDMQVGYFNLVPGQQDYNIYTDIVPLTSGSLIGSGSNIKLKVMEVYHFNPIAAQHYLLNAANVTNFLAQNFNYESYVNSTVFYVLPVFEDILRRSELDLAFRVRRSNYSWDIMGRNLRIYPVPAQGSVYPDRLFIKVAGPNDPYNPAYTDSSIYGVSGPNNVPFDFLLYNTINAPGKQWIREYTLALCKEVLGRIRGKYKSIPIPNADLTLDGEELVSQGREDKEKLLTELKEWFENLTYDKMLENQATRSENIMKQLRATPMPLGKSIMIF